MTNQLGSSTVMREQLGRLLRISQRPGVTLRLVAAPTSFTACGWYLVDYEKAGSVVLLAVRQESLRFKKSSRSGGQSNGAEVAQTLRHVRDSKNPEGPLLHGVDVAALNGVRRDLRRRVPG